MAKERIFKLLQSVSSLFRGQRGVVLFSMVGIVLFIIAGGLWEYTNSNTFCGTACHTMPPEYEAYQISPHARVKCVECHLGRGLLATQFTRKLGDAGHGVTYLLRRFERPIYVTSMRPARETCEKCHWPIAFHDDSVREIQRFAADEENTESRTYLIMHTGGGTAREGRGKGIHWHVENQVWYIATDEHKQNIPWVRVIDHQGRVTDYQDVTVELDPEFIEEAPKRLMDCIDCHNRIAHQFRSPQKAVDNALALHQISQDIPFIKKVGVEVLSAEYSSMEEGLGKIAELWEFYSSFYPDFYNSHREEVMRAIQVLQGIFMRTVFPDMGVAWQSHSDNDGHDEFPGCFRCHDGKHISEQGESVRLHCNICHSIPVTVGADERPPEMPFTAIAEPPSHIATDWMARHRFEANHGCEDCHGPYVFGSDGSNFCSNSSCHGRGWEWVGLDAAFTHPIELVGRHADLTCNQCHEQATKPENRCAACHERHPHDWGSQECELCHSPLGWRESTTGALGAPVPHAVDGHEDCLACHSLEGILPSPADHAGRTNELCGACHVAEKSP